MDDFREMRNAWPVQANAYRQNARYEQQLLEVVAALEDFRESKGAYRNWDPYMTSVRIMSQLELFFFEEFEQERKGAEKDA